MAVGSVAKRHDKKYSMCQKLVRQSQSENIIIIYYYRNQFSSM